MKGLVCFGTIGLAACTAGRAVAAPAVTFVPVTTTATSGTLHVRAVDAAATDEVGTYQVSVRVVPESGATGTITLTAAQPANPLFAGAGQGPLASYILDASNGNTYFVSSDSPQSGGTAPLGATPVDLFDLSYTALPNTLGTFDLQFFVSPTDSLGSYLGGAFDMGSFSNPPIAGTSFTGGSVTVGPVPEPASMAALAGVGAVACLSRRRRRAAR